MSKLDVDRNVNANGSVKHDDRSTQSHNDRLAMLVERWQTQDASDLALRHETGVLLNDIYGDPTQRQRRGAFTMKNVSKRLGILVSELSRMRQFAHQFKSISDLHEQHPLAKNWTKVRDLLPKRSKGRKASSADSKSPALRKARRALATLSGTLKDFGDTPCSEDRQLLVASLQGFAATVPPVLGIRLVVEDRSSDMLTKDTSQDAMV